MFGLVRAGIEKVARMGITAVFVLLAVMGWIVTTSLAGANWKAIVAADPAYASELYTPPFDQVFYRLGPVNSWVLFRRRPPLAVARRIRALRIAVVVQVCVVIGVVACLIWAR